MSPKVPGLSGKIFFIVEVYERVNWEVHDVPDVRMLYLDRVQPTGVVRAFPVESESTLCFYLKVGELHYIAVPVNTLVTEI